ncbi:type II secretion system protein GspG [Seonamhaeicola marinus]|uniref:Type II secretion system protein GspG C-terminal domain-containing protein n=1 Tax=Seonamhaeicola marinus TaxID=1912246 RepID=A0A5D0ITE1_9FLAO|nr:type II secretion system protein GspG [Seonamhaeicola marinus]TYA86786.1 hypothetical protein FUA24_04470 [Seonamhaeicola marinus]
MIQGILELIADFWLDIADYKHEKKVGKKEKKDGIKRPLEKYFLQPSTKTTFLALIVFGLGFVLFFIYQKRVIYPKNTKEEIQQITEWIEMWYDKYESYPKSLKEAIGTNPMRQDWYRDAWGREYKYSLMNGMFKIVSAGKDGEFGTKDDVNLK